MRSLAHFISFQEGLVLYKKYIIVNKEVHSVSLKNTTVKPAQVKLALAALLITLLTYLNET